ncbi:response regulator [uncultured Methanobrevibacter sp.]|uniref:response regulator n=1 Tax=uncultured Methanobrevibacter sp. TaxID=253161 RepID=UPI0026006024|nr:response regulator [uncultured Methanobrevibacter sp.]MCI6994879.1 response regulator [Methanobrevibacter sp.]
MNEKILVVEDEAITALDLKFILMGLGYDVVDVVDNGQDAIDSAKELSPDLVIMDIKLKGEINGIVAAEEISKFNIPIIFASANTDEGTKEKVLENSSFVGFIPKPFGEEVIEEYIGNAFDKINNS